MDGMHRCVSLNGPPPQDGSKTLTMRIAAKVTPGESRVAKSNASAERFTFTAKKSDVTNGEAEGATGGKPTPKSSILNVNQEEIEDFAAVRAQIFPVLKARSWVDVTQDLLTKIDPKSKAGVLYAPLKSVPGSDIGYTLAIIRDQPDSLSYILTSHLEAWATSESVLQKVAIGNLEKKFDEFGDDLWIRSKTGIYYINTSLRSLSASVILLPRFIERLDVESGDPVVVVPSSDLCMVAGSKMETRLCIVGEMSLRYSSDPHHLNTSLRLNKARMIMAKYSPKSFAGEFPIPSTAEEVAGLKLRVQQVRR
ncbi:uncharacterized protein [Montipora foliosa]|uniref:uncharacterized protein n=1 Tax=Montipora foliosa TaxID=591990 RepID=UPI0035F1B043